MVLHDGGSPSYGVCQLKQTTAEQMGYKGRPKDLMNPKINAYWAAKYLRYQLKRYGGDFCKASAAYNSGTYMESNVYPGKPRNLKYINGVKKYLDFNLHDKISCDMLEAGE